MLRPILLLGAVIIAAMGLGFGFADVFDASRSGLERSGIAAIMILAVVVAYGLWRADLELRNNDERIAARAWPFPSKVVPIDQVLKSEVVKIDPMRDYGGWGLKGTRRDMLIGGGGTTALRITYTHESGEERKLTFLTERAEEADQLLTSQRTR